MSLCASESVAERGYVHNCNTKLPLKIMSLMDLYVLEL